MQFKEYRSNHPIDINQFKADFPSFGKLIDDMNSFAPYEGKPDLSEWDEDLKAMLPERAKEGHEDNRIDSVWLTKV